MSPAPAAALSPRQRELALAFARALVPAGRRFPGAGERTVSEVEQTLAEASPRAVQALAMLLGFLDRAALVRTGRRFHKLPARKQEALLQRWMSQRTLRVPLMLLAMLLKTCHFDSPETYEAVGYQYAKGGPAEPERWLSQVANGDEWEDGGEIECDVVVVGSGAGGAVVGTELALQGHAVVFLEEGALYRRDSFTGAARASHRKFYRGGGGLFALGNNAIPILMGKMVGGSTAINTGVSYRTPDRILHRWCERMDTSAFEPERMRPYFEKVERELDVRPVDEKFLQGTGRVIARGCEALGWHHYVLKRNAPDCTGEGVCDFGCPSSARRSVDIAYLPQACARGAMVFANTRATGVRIENGRAVGLLAQSTGTGRTLWVRSRVVVLSGGAVPTPVFLGTQGLCNSSGQVGRNLSIHPSTGCSALFSEEIEEEAFIPNTRSCDEFLDRGILLQSGHPSLNALPITIPFLGQRLMDVMDRFNHVAGFGVMIEDDERPGRVRATAEGKARISYWITRRDVGRLHEAMALAARMWLAAGAERIFPLLYRFPEIQNEKDLARFRALDVKPWDFLTTSWHPLGTCEMGRDPKRSVVGLNHESHDVKNLFIADGSTVPGPLGVNPQVTIMAMATRAAEAIAERLG